MPELPEVETVVRNLIAAKLVGCVIQNVRVYWPRIVDGARVPKFVRALTGQRITGIGRRAKFIVIRRPGGSFAYDGPPVLRSAGRQPRQASARYPAAG